MKKNSPRAPPKIAMKLATLPGLRVRPPARPGEDAVYLPVALEDEHRPDAVLLFVFIIYISGGGGGEGEAHGGLPQRGPDRERGLPEEGGGGGGAVARVAAEADALLGGLRKDSKKIRLFRVRNVCGKGCVFVSKQNMCL